MDFDKLLDSRFSCRHFDSKPVPKDLVLKLLEAGHKAPSAINSQPWYFYVINDLEKNKKIGMEAEGRLPEEQRKRMQSRPIKASNHIFYDAPCVIYICRAKESTPFATFDAGLAAENILLKAETLGLATVPVGSICGAGVEFVEKSVNVSSEHTFVLAIAVGYRAPDDDGKPNTRKSDYYHYTE